MPGSVPRDRLKTATSPATSTLLPPRAEVLVPSGFSAFALALPGYAGLCPASLDYRSSSTDLALAGQDQYGQETRGTAVKSVSL